MRKKCKALLCIILCLCFLFSGTAAFADQSFSYTPNTPIEYDLKGALFKTAYLTTGTNTYNKNDNWKYYYWCHFKPQYTAEYTTTITVKYKMAMELYDSDNNLLGSSRSEDPRNENYRYVFSLTYLLEEGKTYYYKMYYTNGYYNSCGPFDVSMTSTGASKLPSDDHLHVYLNGRIWGAQIEQKNYSPQAVLDMLSIIVVFSDGSFRKWSRKEQVYFEMEGCDIIIDMGDCNNEIRTHTMVVHYMGRTATVDFDVVECIHSYSTPQPVKPDWVVPSCKHFTCSKCGSGYDTDYTINGKYISDNFLSQLNKNCADSGFNSDFDINSDGSVNTRDYSELYNMKQQAKKKYVEMFNSKRGSSLYNSHYDVNNDGIINTRDYTKLFY